MATYVNHAAVAAPRNGTNSHTVGPTGTGGTVVAGTAFTPTSGSLLVCVVEGAVTSSTPSGWTLPAGGSAVNNTGLYLWHRSAASGANSLSTTHNGGNYPVIFHFFEFAAGSTFVKAAAATGVSSGSAGPTLTSLTGSNWTAGVDGEVHVGAGTITHTWNKGTEAVDTSAPASGTDGYGFSVAFIEDNANASESFVTTVTGGTLSSERIAFAVVAASSGGSPTTGTLSASVPRVTSSIAGTVTAPSASGTLSASVPRVTASLAGTVSAPSSTGTLSASTPLPTASIAGTVTPPTYGGTVSGTLPKTTGSISGTVTPPTYTGTLTAAIPPTRATITGTVTSPAGAATLSGTLPRVTGSLTGTVTAPTWTGTLDGELAPITGSILGTVTGPVFTGTLDGTLPGVTGGVTGTATVPTGAGTLAATLPHLTGSLVGVVTVDDDLVPASARILATTVRAPSARGVVRTSDARGTLRTPTAQGRLR